MTVRVWQIRKLPQDNQNVRKPFKMDWQKAKKDREEYFEKLRKWLDDARLWYSLSASTGSNTLSGLQFPLDGFQGQSGNIPHNQQNPYAAFYQIPPADQNQEAHILNNEQVPNADLGNNFENNNAFNRVPFYQTYPFILPPNLLRLPTTYEFKIPPLWKRLCAELIDFCVLFTLKLALTFVFMESFSVGSALYGLDMIQKGLLEDQEVNLPLAFELMFLEALHKLVVLFFETYFLHGKTCATPGKRCMGLMVVQVEGLNLIPNRPIETVSATGVKALGWQRAFLRSTLKNLIMRPDLIVNSLLKYFRHRRLAIEKTIVPMFRLSPFLQRHWCYTSTIINQCFKQCSQILVSKFYNEDRYVTHTTRKLVRQKYEQPV